MNKQKVCARCAQSKDVEQFRTDVRYKDGRASWCKRCVREYQKERHETDPGRNREYQRKYREQKRSEDPAGAKAKDREYQQKWRIGRTEEQLRKQREYQRVYRIRRRAQMWADIQRRKEVERAAQLLKRLEEEDQ